MEEEADYIKSSGEAQIRQAGPSRTTIPGTKSHDSAVFLHGSPPKIRHESPSHVDKAMLTIASAFVLPIVVAGAVSTVGSVGVDVAIAGLVVIGMVDQPHVDERR